MIRLNNKVLFGVALVLIVLLTLVTACGGPAESPPAGETDDPAQSPPAEDEEEPVGDEPAEEEPAEGAEPSGDCPAATAVEVASTNGAYASREPISWDSIGTQEAYVDGSMGSTTVNIYIANFSTQESLKGFKPEEDSQAILHFALRIRGEGNEVPVEMGEYNLKNYDESDLHVTPKIVLSGGSALQISTHDIESSEFIVTSVTATEICGTFSVDEKWTQMSGAFKVPIVN